ncbi:MAG: tyrosine-type recombinase/integrase [Actinobacteria bacterium]|jgi:integrase|nr:tyrosine-type recombinase/integrase [Actinomycetota bacterium]
MSYHQLPSGAYRARLMINGVRYTATLPTRDDAKDWEALIRAKAVSGSLPRRISVRDYAARWMTTYETAPTSTRAFHEGNLSRYILPVLGVRSVADVTPTEISRLINAVSAQVSVATADAAYRTCSALFNAAVADDVMVKSPVKSKRHRPRRQREPHVVLERLEARQLLLHLKGWHRDAALLQLALGARVGEIGGLTPHDIDLHRRRVTIRRRHYRGTIRATKNHRMRTLELPTITIPTMGRLIAAAGDVPRIPPLDDREHDAEPFLKHWLIQTSTGRPVNTSAYDKALIKACASAEVPRVSSHALRHTYVSWMIDEGHSADKIAFWIGDTPETVRAVYAHMLEESSAPAAASIDAALGGGVL